jgi:hypothetical protein
MLETLRALIVLAAVPCSTARGTSRGSWGHCGVEGVPWEHDCSHNCRRRCIATLQSRLCTVIDKLAIGLWRACLDLQCEVEMCPTSRPLLPPVPA